tara:strand:- start:1297 stop:1755 length:459 start_codon:yes stop_codon:yes gene_type:complete
MKGKQMEKIIKSKIEELTTVSVSISNWGSSAFVYKGSASPLNFSSETCQDNLFMKTSFQFLGLSIPCLEDIRGKRFCFIKDVAAASGRQISDVYRYFRKADAMIRVGYRPKHYGGRPSIRAGVEHVNQNLIPLLHVQQYLRTRPEIVKKKGK